MNLNSLRPQFRQGEPDWGNTEDFAKAIGIEFYCPGCFGKPWEHRLWAPFQGRYPMQNVPKWAASGTGYHDLTFSDSPQGSRSIRVTSGCKSHFNVTSGTIDFYADSGHTTYQPTINRETHVESPTPETSTPTIEATDAVPAVTPVEHVIAENKPTGFAPTLGLKYLNGSLHQLHENGSPGVEPAHVWVPVCGTATPAGLLNDIEQMVAAMLQQVLHAKINEVLGVVDTKIKQAITPAA